MYAITWNEAGTRMIQIGIEPKRLLKELKQNEISAVVSDMPVYKGIEIFVVDSQTKIVKGATDSRQIDVKLEGLVVSSAKKSGETDVRLIRIGGKRCKCLLSQYDSYIVAVTMDSSFYRQGNIFAVLIVGVYLVLASCCMFYMLSVYRIGGDEFVVIITGNTKEFQSIIESFDRRVAQWHGKLVDSMTISWGYVFSSEKEWDNIYDIAKEADERMYKNKERYYQESKIVRRR